MASTPRPEEYIISNHCMFFSYQPEQASFITSHPWDKGITVAGTVVIRLPQVTEVHKVLVEFKGRETVKWSKLGKVYCENIIERSEVIWQSENLWGYELKDELILPFEIKVPVEIPESFETGHGNVKYTLKATLNTSRDMKPIHIEVLVPITKWSKPSVEDLQPLTIKSQNKNRKNLVSWRIILPKTSWDLGSKFDFKLQIVGHNPELRVHKINTSLKNFIRYKFDGDDDSWTFKKEHRCFKRVIRSKDIIIFPEGTDCIFEATIEMQVPGDAIPTFETRFMKIVNQLQVKVFYERS
ncbi:14464_t:CDS:1, partial [Acaulospora morrowiae]